MMKIQLEKFPIITYEDFIKVDLRSGTITKVEEFSRAKKPAYKVWVDFGPTIGILQTSAQITAYSISSLVGRMIVGCVNLAEKNIAGFISQFLLVGFINENNEISIVNIEPKVPNGQKIC